MKTLVCVGLCLIGAGCAWRSGEEEKFRGSPGSRTKIQTGATDEDYFPYRSGPGLPSTDRAFPQKNVQEPVR